jgi:CarD family transcriptional regulator
MKAKVGTARSDRKAAALRQAAPHRVVARTAAKAARAVVAKKATAPAKHAKPTHGKSVAQPVKKASPAAKPAPKKSPATKTPMTKAPVTKPPATKPQARKPTAAMPVPAKPQAKPPTPTQAPVMAAAKSAGPRTPAAPLQAVQPKPAPPAPRPAPTPAPVAAAPTMSTPVPARRPIMPDRPPVRPMAKAEIFVEGDHVVYPTHGVGKVERIATEEIAGHKLELIHITFEENRMTLRVPVSKARTAGLRKLATRKLFDEALAVLKGRARIKRTMWSRRAQEYEAKINSGDPLAIAEVVRDLHRNAGQPDQSFSERQIYEAAMDRLAAELAALDKTDKLTAAGKLVNFLKTV